VVAEGSHGRIRGRQSEEPRCHLRALDNGDLGAAQRGAGIDDFGLRALWKDRGEGHT
jgi:hypothetical protein